MVFFAVCFVSQGQSLLRYEVEGSCNRTEEAYFPDSLSREVYLQEQLLSFKSEGFSEAFIKSKTFSGDTLDVQVDCGQAFLWITLRKGNLDNWPAFRVVYDEKDLRLRPLDFQSLAKLFDSILDEAQDIGYPFASVRLDSMVREGNGLSAAINVDPGPYITFDTLKVTGDSRTKPIYLSRLLKARPGTAFSQSKLDESLRILQKLPFLQLVDEPQLTFQNETAQFLLPVNDRRINTLDGIIGILPNESENNRLLVTGQFDLSLYNVSGKGRNYHLQWQRLSQYSQNLAFSAEEPMLFGSGIDLKLSFSLLKEDTTFVNRDFRADLKYSIHPDLSIGFFSRRQAGDLLDVSPWLSSESSPDIADFRFNNYGMNLTWNTLDDVFLPRRGWLSYLEGGVGNKRILENTGLPSSAYQGLEMNSTQYYLNLSAEKHFSFTKGVGTMIRLRGGEMANKNLLLNDLFRLGGLNSIRGFNENFFFANRYLYANFEPRFYFDSYSYFLLFFDMAGMKDNKGNIDRPFSFGGGISLETDEGVFNFIYALGKSETQVLGFNFSKIHFGYTGRF